MSHQRVTIMLPTERAFQTLLATLVGRCCLITQTVWTPFTLAGALALGVLNNQKSHYLQEIIANTQLYQFDPRRRLLDLDAHTVMVSIYPEVLAQLDDIKTILRDKAKSNVGLTRTSVLIAIYAWSADLSNTDLVVLLAPEMNLRAQKIAEQQKEHELIIESTRAELDVAQQLGRTSGKKLKMTESKIEAAKELLASGVRVKDVTKILDVSSSTLRKWLPVSRAD